MPQPHVRAAFRGALVFIAAALLSACAKGAPPDEGVSKIPGGSAPLRLAMVTDARGLGDRSFNDGAYAGLLQAKQRLGADVAVLQSKSASDYGPNMTTLAAQDFDEVFAVGYLMDGDLRSVARNYPRRHFAMIDAVVDEPNVTSVTFREQDGSFLAGALAAMVSKTKTIGFLGGIDVPREREFEAGFGAGAREIDPRVKVIDTYVGSFEDVAAGKRRAGAIFDGGADVLYVAAGKSGLGAIAETRARPHAYAIGVDSNQDSLAPGKVLTSVLKRIDVAVFDVSEDAQSLKLPAGPMELGLREGGVALTDFKYTKKAIGSRALARLAHLRQAIVDGKITPPKTRDGLAAFKPVKV